MKAFHGTLPMATHIPTWFQGHEAGFVPTPAAILDRRVVKFQNHAQVQYLVRWENADVADTSWEAADAFEAKFPDFDISF